MPDGSNLPGWPRALNVRLASEYVSLSVTTFRAVVAPEVRAVHLTGKRVAWLRDDLDRWLEARAGRRAEPERGNSWDAVL